MASVVITGADGYIGRHLVHYLAEQNELEIYAVIIPNSPLRYHIENLSHVHILEYDLSEYTKLEQYLPQEPLAVLHLAWAGVSPQNRHDVTLQCGNIELCLNAVRLAHGVRAQRFILPGSTMEYTGSDDLISAKTPPTPENAYGAAKIAARYMCEALCEELKVPYIYLVISGSYAADRKDNNVIYYTIFKLLRGERPALTNLEQLWDYIHIDDVVYALSLIISKGRPGAYYSVGHGDNCPLANYIYMIRDLIDPNLPLGIGDIPYKDDRIPNASVDLRPLYEDTGFKPRIPFEQGIRQVIDEMRQQMSEEEEK